MESCKLVNTPQVSDEIKDRVKNLVTGISDFTKEQLRSEMPDIPKDAINDLYEGYVCKAICEKSKGEYEKFTAKGYGPVEASRMALINELVSLRDKGVLPDDIALENIIRDIKIGTTSRAGNNYSGNLYRAYDKFQKAAGNRGYHRSFTYLSHDPKLTEYYLDIMAKFNMGTTVFIKEAMDFYIENHQEELEEIKRRENDEAKEEEDKKESVSEKNRRLFG